MARLEPWAQRPPEEANLFNPPFVGALLVEFLREFTKGNKAGASLFLLIIGITSALHLPTRKRLPYSTITSLLSWAQENEDLLVEFAGRSRNMTVYIKEALSFALASKVIKATDGGNFVLGETRLSITKSFLDYVTPETKEIIERTRFVGRWLSKSGSEPTIAAIFGVKP